MLKRFVWKSALAVLLLALATVASAAVNGDLKIGSGGTMTVSLSSITFNPDPSAHPAGPPWNGAVSNGTTLAFAGCPTGVLGAPGCLDGAPFSPTEGIELANGVPITLGGGLGPNNPFLQFAGSGVTHATILYTVTQLGPGSANTNCAAAVNIGDSCSVFAGSPVVFTHISSGTTATIPAAGTVSDGSGTTNWLGIFAIPIAGMTPAQLQSFFCPSGTCTAADFASGKSISSSYSGDMTAGNPVTPPACGLDFSSASASPSVLWPPNHKLVPVVITATVSDTCSESCKITDISSNEPVGPGGDWVMTGNLTLDLRAERSGTGSGRTYTITVQCTDSALNVATKTVTVTVPHDQGH